MMTSDNPLTRITELEAKELKRLYAEASLKISQEQFGDLYEIGSQGMVWQYLNGRRPLNLKAAIGFAVGLSKSLDEISPSITRQVETAWKITVAGSKVDDSKFPEHGDLPRNVAMAINLILHKHRQGAKPEYFDALTTILNTESSDSNVDKSTTADRDDVQCPTGDSTIRKQAASQIAASTEKLAQRGEGSVGKKRKGTSK